MKYPKFIIYYQPPSVELTGLKSLTLSFSRLDEETNTYKQKLIAEAKDESGIVQKYKISEFHIGLDKIQEKINAVDFNQSFDKPEHNSTSPIFLIKYDDKKIETSNYNQVKEILELFRFSEMINISRKHYHCIKDLYEYLELQDIIQEKCKRLSPSLKSVYFSLIQDEDPYKTFQNMGWLEEYLNTRKNN